MTADTANDGTSKNDAGVKKQEEVYESLRGKMTGDLGF